VPVEPITAAPKTKTAAKKATAETVAVNSPVTIAHTVRVQLDRVLAYQPPAPVKAALDVEPLLAEPVALAEPVIPLPVDDSALWAGVFVWLAGYTLGQVGSATDTAQQGRSWYDEWLFGKIAADALYQLGFDQGTVEQTTAGIKLWIAHQSLLTSQPTPDALLTTLLGDADVQSFLRVNRYDGVLWYNKEAFESLLGWLTALSIAANADPKAIAQWQTVTTTLREWSDQAEYRVDKLRAPAPVVTPAKPSAAKSKNK
jgi:hypothetical protein